jgi:hypothetical protein
MFHSFPTWHLTNPISRLASSDFQTQNGGSKDTRLSHLECANPVLTSNICTSYFSIWFIFIKIVKLKLVSTDYFILKIKNYIFLWFFGLSNKFYDGFGFGAV